MFRTSACFALLLLAACQGSADGPAATGACTPTVAGGPQPTYANYREGRAAFTRRSEDGTLAATLEDAAWLRYEGDPATVEKAHRAYFEYGYTSFQVLLRVRDFTQPTQETFTLEDSAGARVVGKPVTYEGSSTLVDGMWQYAFDLSFQHTLTASTRWLKLTRDADGAFVQWDFGG